MSGVELSTRDDGGGVQGSKVKGGGKVYIELLGDIDIQARVAMHEDDGDEGGFEALRRMVAGVRTQRIT